MMGPPAISCVTATNVVAQQSATEKLKFIKKTVKLFLHRHGASAVNWAFSNCPSLRREGGPRVGGPGDK